MNAWLLNAKRTAGGCRTGLTCCFLLASGLARSATTGPFEVDISSREQVRSFYQTAYAASEGVAIGWTGTLTGCDPGTTSSLHREAVLRRVNAFRALAGIPSGVVLREDYSARAQRAALIMSANNRVTHTPPSNWICFHPDGAEGALNSDLALGVAGIDAVVGYMDDFGTANGPVGHRRYLLYPQTRQMGVGDVEATSPVQPFANAIWVIDGQFNAARPATRDGFVAWPPPGFVPYPLVYARWSLSYPKADFRAATVRLRLQGKLVPVRIEPVSTDFAENTLVWVPHELAALRATEWPRPSEDTRYEVEVANVTLAGVTTNFSYAVTVFDPAVETPGFLGGRIEGADRLNPGETARYDFTPVPWASGHEWLRGVKSPVHLAEGAEDGLGRWIDQTSPDYPAIVPGLGLAGSSAFHLAHPRPVDQHLLLNGIFVPGVNAELRFHSRLARARPAQVARVQVSRNAGGHWEDLFAQPGTSTIGEQAFAERILSLAAHAGRPIQVRFSYDYTSGTFFSTTDETSGWFIDNVILSGVEELTDSQMTDLGSETSFELRETAAGTYSLHVRPRVFSGFHGEWGPAKTVAVAAPLPPEILFEPGIVVVGERLYVTVRVANLPPGGRFELQRTSHFADGWRPEPGASFEEMVPGAVFRVAVPLDEREFAAFRLVLR